MGKRPLFAELGKTGVKWQAGYINEEFLIALQGTAGIKIYREMSDNDPIIGAFLFAIEQIIREARWDVKPYKKDDPESEEDARFLKECMVNMESAWTDFITEVLSMLTYGWSWFEIVFKRNEKNKMVWKKIAPRIASSFERWDLTPNGDILGMVQRPAPDYREITIPKWKSIHFRTKPNGNNPEGRSILRNSYRPWYFKKHLEEIEAIGIERDLVGIPILKLPEGIDPESEDAEQIAKITSAKQLISSVRRDEQEGVLMPFGWELKLLESPGTKQINTTEVINRYNKQIAVTVLAQFILLGMERTGSYALSDNQSDMFYLCMEGWANGISATLNRQAVPSLFKLNGVFKKELPQIVHSPIRHLELKEITQFVAGLAKVNAIEIDEELKGYLKSYAQLSEFSETSK